MAHMTVENFEYLNIEGIKATIKVKNSPTKARGSPSRAKHVREVEFQYGVLNLMINEIPVYLAIK